MSTQEQHGGHRAHVQGIRNPHFREALLDRGQWTFNASVFGHAGDPEMIRRMQHRRWLTTKEEAEKEGIAFVRKWIDDGLPDLS